jgi:hypothetical protein
VVGFNYTRVCILALGEKQEGILHQVVKVMNGVTTPEVFPDEVGRVPLYFLTPAR